MSDESATWRYPGFGVDEPVRFGIDVGASRVDSTAGLDVESDAESQADEQLFDRQRIADTGNGAV